MTAEKLREWRGVKPVPGPTGVAITTRLRTTPEDEFVLDAMAEHLGWLRRADLAAVSRPMSLDPELDDAGKRHARRTRLNSRKAALTAQSSARWANAIIRANDDQYRLSRDAQARHIISLRVAIATIEKRLAQPLPRQALAVMANFISDGSHGRTSGIAAQLLILWPQLPILWPAVRQALGCGSQDQIGIGVRGGGCWSSGWCG